MQVYKSHLTEGRAPSGPAVDSARQNLASTFVNAFVNAGFGQDKLMTVIPETESTENVHWIFKNKVSRLSCIDSISNQDNMLANLTTVSMRFHPHLLQLH